MARIGRATSVPMARARWMEPSARIGKPTAQGTLAQGSRQGLHQFFDRRREGAGDGQQGQPDIVWCLDAKSGKEIWTHKYAEKLDPKLYDGGPNATPTIDGDVVYTLSRTGNLFCLSMADGKPKWHKHFQSDLKWQGAELGLFGIADREGRPAVLPALRG
jgi:outer membrane protein assembly factor BamB